MDAGFVSVSHIVKLARETMEKEQREAKAKADALKDAQSNVNANLFNYVQAKNETAAQLEERLNAQREDWKKKWGGSLKRDDDKKKNPPKRPHTAGARSRTRPRPQQNAKSPQSEKASWELHPKGLAWRDAASGQAQVYEKSLDTEDCAQVPAGFNVATRAPSGFNIDALKSKSCGKSAFLRASPVKAAKTKSQARQQAKLEVGHFKEFTDDGQPCFLFSDGIKPVARVLRKPIVRAKIEKARKLDSDIRVEEDAGAKKKVSFEKLTLSNATYLVAKYDFKAQGADDIDLKKGDRILVLDRHGKNAEGWWTGQNLTTHKTGQFPSNFTKVDAAFSAAVPKLPLREANEEERADQVDPVESARAEEEANEVMSEAAESIQALVRGRSARIETTALREEIDAKTEAAKIVQALCRGQSTRKALNERAVAAEKLQAVERGRRERGELQLKRKASLRIQAAQRGRREREEYAAKKQAAKTLQAVQRGKAVREDNKRKQNAAASIQKVQRRRSAAKLECKRNEEEKRAEILAQEEAEWQALQAEGIAEENAGEAKVGEDEAAFAKTLAATAFQRGMEIASSATVSVEEKSSTDPEQSAAMKIQGVHRGRSVRKEFESKKECALKIQSLQRGRSVRRASKSADAPVASSKNIVEETARRMSSVAVANVLGKLENSFATSSSVRTPQNDKALEEKRKHANVTPEVLKTAKDCSRKSIIAAMGVIEDLEALKK